MIAEVERQYKSVLALVDRHGLAIPCLPGSGRLPPVAFTVGGAAQGMPDLVVLGLGGELAHNVLNNTFRQLRNLWPCKDGTRIEGVLDGLVLGVRDVSDSDLLDRTMFLTALFNKRRGHDQTSIFQVCWPDRHGLLPYEQGCDPATVAVQGGHDYWKQISQWAGAVLAPEGA